MVNETGIDSLITRPEVLEGLKVSREDMRRFRGDLYSTSGAHYHESFSINSTPLCGVSLFSTIEMGRRLVADNTGLPESELCRVNKEIIVVLRIVNLN